jgi:archaellum biogenesis protein FlaJ (TadC family)
MAQKDGVIMEMMSMTLAILARSNAAGSGLVGALTAAEFGLPALIIAAISTFLTKKEKQQDEDAVFIKADEEMYQKMITMETMKTLVYVLGIISLLVGIGIFALGQLAENSGRTTMGVVVAVAGLVLCIVSVLLSAQVKKIRRQLRDIAERDHLLGKR